MTGIAAILHYAIEFPDFSDDEDSNDSEDNESNNKFGFSGQSKKESNLASDSDQASSQALDDAEIQELFNGGFDLVDEDDLNFEQDDEEEEKQINSEEV